MNNWCIIQIYSQSADRHNTLISAEFPNHTIGLPAAVLHTHKALNHSPTSAHTPNTTRHQKHTHTHTRARTRAQLFKQNSSALESRRTMLEFESLLLHSCLILSLRSWVSMSVFQYIVQTQKNEIKSVDLKILTKLAIQIYWNIWSLMERFSFRKQTHTYKTLTTGKPNEKTCAEKESFQVYLVCEWKDTLPSSDKTTVLTASNMKFNSWRCTSVPIS